jgi:hypothetical protein
MGHEGWETMESQGDVTVSTVNRFLWLQAGSESDPVKSGSKQTNANAKTFALPTIGGRQAVMAA